MAFSDDFASALSNAGIPIDASVVPTQDVLQSGLNSLSEWLNSLDEGTRSAVEEVTADFPIKFGLSDPLVNIAPGLSDLLAACDSLQTSLSISTILDTCNSALGQVSL
jgi:hypothetical protein